jgi:acyl-CoA oxidase
MGDLGPKFGFHTKDNGYLIMKNVRTHRKNMLRRYAKV